MTDMTTLAEICDRFALDALYLFGSRAREATEALREGRSLPPSKPSDLDVGVLLMEGCRLEPRERVRLMAALEDLFGVGRVDLVVLSESSAFLALDVIRGELVYDRNPDRAAAFELYVMRRAGDLIPYQRERMNQVLAGKSS